MIAVDSIATVVAFAGITLMYQVAHAVVGSLCGARVEVISLGTGPVLFERRFGSIQLFLKLLIFSGYTKFYSGDEAEDFDRRSVDADQPGFLQLPVPSRALIMLSGPISSLAVGLGLAVSACLLPQSEVVVAPAPGNVVPSAVPGLTTTGQPASWRSQGDLLRGTFLEFGLRCLTGGSLKGWGGFVGSLITCGAVAMSSFGAWLSCFSVLCLAAGILNLLPVPLLNGGHLALLLVEALFGRPGDRVIQTISWIGLLLIMLFFGSLILRDIIWLMTTNWS